MAFSLHRWRLLLALFVSVLLFLLLSPFAFACTEIYVGKDVSEDGSVIVARCNDNQSVWATRVEVTGRVENKPGRTMPVTPDGNVTAEIPATTYKYTSTPWMSSIQAENKLGPDAATCSNEYGVTMTMAVTAFANKAALNADPLVKEGLGESFANDLVICQSRTAREAVETLCGLLDEFGSSETNIATIADANEVWYIEIYTGHQYAAVLLPSDKVAAFGNEFSLEYLSDYEDYIISDELESLAVSRKFAVYGENDELNLWDTYSGSEKLIDYSHRRTWILHSLLAPKSYGDYDQSERYPLVFAPEKKVSVQDVFELMRNRFEGTEFSPEEQGRDDVRVVGTDTSMSVHVIQICPDLPAEMSCVTWVSLGPALYGVFIPVSNCSTEIDAGFNADQSADEGCVFNGDDYIWYNIKAINALGLINPDVYGAPVREYFAQAEAEMTAGMAALLKEACEIYETDPEAAISMITEYCCEMQKNAFADSKEILASQLWTLSLNSNTMKKGVNPETHEALDTYRELTPVEIALKADKYGFAVPEKPKLL